MDNVRATAAKAISDATKEGPSIRAKLAEMVKEWDDVESFNSSMEANDMLDDFVERMRKIAQ